MAPSKNHGEFLDEEILVKIAYKEMKKFEKKFPKVSKYRFGIDYGSCVYPGHCRKRDYAYCDSRRKLIVLSYRMFLLPMKNIIGLIRHELGHASDPNLMEHGAEQRADDIAEYVTGQKIRYDRENVQTIGRGKYPRPKELHE